MARARKTATKTRAKRGTANVKKTSAARGSSSFKCPECGKTFARAAALGAHRNRAHGVAGATAKKRASSRRRATATLAERNGAAPRRRRRRTVNREALLAMLFPAGVPAKEDVIRSVNSWLDEAERLAAS